MYGDLSDLESLDAEDVLKAILQRVYTQTIEHEYRTGDKINLVLLPHRIFDLCRMAWSPRDNTYFRNERGEWKCFDALVVPHRGKDMRLLSEMTWYAPTTVPKPPS